MPTTGKKQKKPRKLSKQQILIKAFIADGSKFSWPNEMRIAKILIDTYGYDFLLSFSKEFKVKSLVWFLGEKGKEHLLKHQKHQKLKLDKKSYELEEKTLGRKKKVSKKPASIKEFLNLFEK